MVEEQQERLSVPVAFGIDVIATLMCQASYLLMKFAHVDAEKTQGKNPLASLKWVLGLSCLLIGSIIHVVLLPFCPLVLLATNSATAIVMSAMMAVYFLDERIVWRYDLAAFILISIGTTIICLLSKGSEKQLTTGVITDQLTSIGTITFGVFYITFIVGNYMLTTWSTGQVRLFERQAEAWVQSRSTHSRSQSTFSTATASVFGGQRSLEATDSSSNLAAANGDYMTSSFTSPESRESTIQTETQQAVVSLSERPYSVLILTIQNTSPEQIAEVAPGVSQQLKRFIKAPMVSQLCLAGATAGISNSFLKWFTELIAQGIYEPQEISLLTITGFIAACAAILQLKFLNTAIARYQQIEVIAVYQVTIIIFTVTCALLLLKEGHAYTRWQLFEILSGTGFCIAGIQVVTWKTNYLQEAVKVSTEVNASEELLLKEEKTNDHTKYLMKLFGDREEEEEETPVGLGLN